VARRRIDWERLERFDRRWIFIMMAFSVLIPLLFPLNLPFRVQEKVKAVHEAVEALEPGSTILFAAEYDPAGKPELEPFAKAVLRRLFAKRVKVVTVTTWKFAPPLVMNLWKEIGVKEHGLTYGEDFAFLGFKEGQDIVIAKMGENLRTLYPKDYLGNTLDELPIMAGKKSLKDFEMILIIGAGFPGPKEYVQQVQGRYDLTILTAVTAVMVPDVSPYYDTGQIKGLVAGMRGAAEYEQIVKRPALATAGLDAQNLAHLFIILAIIFGNVIYLMTRRQRRAVGDKP
jgi:hypothetical protein